MNSTVTFCRHLRLSWWARMDNTSLLFSLTTMKLEWWIIQWVRSMQICSKQASDWTAHSLWPWHPAWYPRSHDTPSDGWMSEAVTWGGTCGKCEWVLLLGGEAYIRNQRKVSSKSITEQTWVNHVPITEIQRNHSPVQNLLRWSQQTWGEAWELYFSIFLQWIKSFLCTLLRLHLHQVSLPCSITATTPPILFPPHTEHLNSCVSIWRSNASQQRN